MGAARRAARCSSCRRSPSRSTRPSTRPSSSTSAPAGTRPRRSTPRFRRATSCSAARKFADLGRTKAELESAEASEVQQRFRTALLTEADYYDVLQNQELARVAADRARARGGRPGRRARPGGLGRRGADRLAPARAGADPGAHRPAAAGRRAPVVAAPARAGASARPGRSTRSRSIRAGARAADRAGRGGAAGPDAGAAVPGRAGQRARGVGVPQAGERGRLPAASSSVTGDAPAVRRQLLPQRAQRVSCITLNVSLPIWDDGPPRDRRSRRRGWIATCRAPSARIWSARRARDVTAGVRGLRDRPGDRRRSPRRGSWWRGRTTGCRTSRYRAGATTILDVLDAQIRLTQSEADLVQARYAARLALAGLEAILGRRLFTNRDVP